MMKKKLSALAMNKFFEKLEMQMNRTLTIESWGRGAAQFARRSQLSYIIRHCKGFARADFSGASLLRPH